MSPERGVASIPDQPLSSTAITEMTQREEWNKKNPPTETTIVKDLKSTELIARAYRKTKARFYRLAGAIRLQPHLSELPPGGVSVKHRHTTEAVLYIVRGTGHTTIHFDGEPEQRVDWTEGDLLGIPLWAWHQHFNDSDTEVARYLAVQDTFTIKQMGLHQIERHPDSPAGE
ncbi:MAG TPA: cupin domain-containing protein [Candidatus Limnocylindrales bacterium]|jgi:quercetin dioxygenase-like cupin family protein|nr:cupin domain-containing protein [Candidatus Limnocylindrales bacterium]